MSSANLEAAVDATRRAAPLRIAYVYRHFDDAGSIHQLYKRNAERLARDEQVTLFCARSSREPTEEPLRFEDVEPLAQGRARLGAALEVGSFAWRASRSLDRARTRFDVVSVEGVASLRADVVTVHAVAAAESTRYFEWVEPQHHPFRPWLAANVFRPQVRVAREIERRLLRPPHPVCLCPSRTVKRDLERIHGVAPDLVEVLPYGVELGRFAFDAATRARLRREAGVDDDRLVLLLVGDELHRKGLDRALAGLAAAAAAAELWVIGGDGVERFRRLARELGVGAGVRFLGRVDPADLSGFYSASDVVLLPSRQDSFSLVVGEAMAAGRVVVSSARNGSSELIVDGATGFVLAGSGSPEQIAALLRGPLRDRELRAAVGAAAAEAAAGLDYERYYERFRAAHYRARARRAGPAARATRVRGRDERREDR